ncbi:hypothetical protein DER46DRAFT_572919 [Fusarium sp. MPI-SDFR-AT-0072]|nr:hypothetical protein DER46DRAFT_572919 [Fusarium sp. MPI-SDFR-AT-0072]
MSDQRQRNLAAIPVEVLNHITSFGSTVLLHLKRVFLSANLLNVKVLQEIANSDKYRKGVAELIWDDTSFGSVENQQHQVHVSRADIDAFVYALERFPSLSRVTITSRAHGRLFMPRYETPMIRAFPYGFVYPLPAHRVFDTDTDFLWDPKELSVTPKLITRRVFCSAPRMLAKREKHKVVEFVVEDHAYTDGVNIDLFDTSLPSLRSLELQFFTFSSPYRFPQLLLDMRQKLGWGKRPVAMRPKVTFVWIGPARLEGQIVKHVSYNLVDITDTTELDEFEPAHERLNFSGRSQQQIQRTEWPV